MRRLRHAWVAALLLAACGQSAQPEQESGSAAPVEATAPAEDAAPEIPPVDASLIGAPNTSFTAIEPSEIGVFGAPTLDEALLPLLAHGSEEAGGLQLSVRETGAEAVADIVRTNLADDSVSAGHLRIEFRRETDGWYPTNAYRRSMCARGGSAGQWTSGLCP